MDLESSLDVDIEPSGVSFTYRLTHVGDGQVSLRFRNGQRIDVVVTGPDDRAVWRASEGRMYTMALGFVTLDAGETVTFDEWWRDPPSGPYRARATLAAEAVDAPATATFEVT